MVLSHPAVGPRRYSWKPIAPVGRGLGPGVVSGVRAGTLEVTSWASRADFTYVPLTGGGFAYTAFVIDAFAGDHRRLAGQPHRQRHPGRPGPGRRASKPDAVKATRSNPAPCTTPTPEPNTPPSHSASTWLEAGSAALHRQRRRRLRQRPGRNHHRPLQNRMHAGRIALPHRPDHPAARGTSHRRLGALVQHQPTDAPPRTTPTSRSRDRALRSTARRPRGRVITTAHQTRCGSALEMP